VLLGVLLVLCFLGVMDAWPCQVALYTVRSFHAWTAAAAAAKMVSAAADVDEMLVGQLTGALVSLMASVFVLLGAVVFG
jgi:hypothetical protein